MSRGQGRGPQHARWRDDLGIDAVLDAIGRLPYAEGAYTGSVRGLAAELGCSRRAVETRLRHLHDQGRIEEIERVGGDQGGCRWRVLTP